MLVSTILLSPLNIAPSEWWASRQGWDTSSESLELEQILFNGASPCWKMVRDSNKSFFHHLDLIFLTPLPPLLETAAEFQPTRLLHMKAGFTSSLKFSINETERGSSLQQVLGVSSQSISKTERKVGSNHLLETNVRQLVKGFNDLKKRRHAEKVYSYREIVKKERKEVIKELKRS